MIDNIKTILQDYIPQYDVFTEDDELITRLKEGVQQLSDADRIIFVLYCETGSLREVGKMLEVSHTTVFKCINKIKEQILNYVNGVINN
jgi:DNA-directed RNA polymerase specialized sigma subunit